MQALPVLTIFLGLFVVTYKSVVKHGKRSKRLIMMWLGSCKTEVSRPPLTAYVDSSSCFSNVKDKIGGTLRDDWRG